MNLKKEIAFRKKVNKQIEKSIKGIMKKYGGIPMEEDFSRFMAEVYIAGAVDAIKNIK